jgi:hypothetical protein
MGLFHLRDLRFICKFSRTFGSSSQNSQNILLEGFVVESCHRQRLENPVINSKNVTWEFGVYHEAATKLEGIIWIPRVNRKRIVTERSFVTEERRLVTRGTLLYALDKDLPHLNSSRYVYQTIFP